ADANEQNLLGESPLHLAVRAGEKSMIDPLIQRGAHIDLPNRAGDTPLHLAARLDFSVGRPLVTMLYERGASVNLRNSYGLTPLHEA
ncbi:ankyrin, partial [Thozetella sp. PMI_491]